MAYTITPSGTPSHTLPLSANGTAPGHTIAWFEGAALLKSGSTSVPSMLQINTGAAGDVKFDATDTGASISFVIDGSSTSNTVVLSNALPTLPSAGPLTDGYSRTGGRPTIYWTYADTDSDHQFLYRVRIGSAPLAFNYADSGKQFSTASGFAFPALNPSIPVGLTYYWTVDVSDGQKLNPANPDFPEPNRVLVTASGSSVVNTPPAVSGIMVNGLSASPVLSSFTPMFSWTYSDVDGQPQQQYQVIVADSPSTMAANVYWDSGPQTGSQSSVLYNFNNSGHRLPAHTTLYVGVKVFDTLTDSGFSFASFSVSNAPLITSLGVDDKVNPLNVSSVVPRFTWR